MKVMHKLAYSALVLFTMTILFSCEPDNVDIVSTDEMETETEIVNCDLVLSLAEQPPGSGQLYSAVSGGTEPYFYEWSNGGAYSETTVNSPGIYYLNVTDADSCVISDTINIDFDNDPCQNITLIITEQPPGSGDLYSSIVGGTPPYQYYWENGDTTPETTVFNSGTHTLIIIDADSLCAVVQTINIQLNNDPCDQFVAEIIEAPLGSGILDAWPTGGTPPYTYNWSDGSTGLMITAPVDGLYGLTITDANGCTDSTSYNVELGSDPCNGLTLSLAEQPPGSGAIYSAVNGGIAPYTYLWSTGETSEEIQVNSFGLYTLSVTDSDSCVVVESIQIN